ncbi:hypothetical protein AGMMS50239_35480 [Bacteroidia bacterium]|nr:hypothetical protein AGMMS50239_35480 [Bacteroidia bacterium]
MEVEKAEWVTRYENYNVDTLVSYTVNNATTLFEYSEDKKDEHFHYVAVKNTNQQYSNLFAVKFEYYYSINNSNKWKYANQHITEYVEIQPNSYYDFEYKWYGVKGSDYSDFYVKTTVLQQPKKNSLTRRIDELHLSTITINTCEQSVEALQKQYQAVKELYYAKIGDVVCTHTVTRGETLSGIARKQGMTLNELILLNNLSNGDNIREGQSLHYVKVDSTKLRIITDKPQSKNNSIY